MFIPALPSNTPANMPSLIAMTFAYNHPKFESSVGTIKAMNEVFDIIKKHQVRAEWVLTYTKTKGGTIF